MKEEWLKIFMSFCLLGGCCCLFDVVDEDSTDALLLEGASMPPSSPTFVFDNMKK